MLRINEYRFYELGQKIAELKSFDPATEIEDAYVSIFQARDAIEAFLEDPLPLTISKPAAHALLKNLNHFDIERVKKLFAGNGKLGLIITRIKKDISTFETVLSAECATIDSYVVPQRGIYRTSDLIDRSEFMLLDEDLRGRLSEQALYDLRQGGRCLAFGIPTGGAFHLLRATETVIKEYYGHLAGEPWPHNKRDWGKYIEELKKLNAPPKITDTLNQVRVNHRNPLMHPEDNLDLQEAFSLFGIIQGLLSMVLQEMN